MSKKKKVIIIITVILVLIALIVGGILIANTIIANNQAKELEEKLSEIDVEELEEKLIEKLEKTTINVNKSTQNSSGDTIGVETMFLSTRSMYDDINEGENIEAYKDYVMAFGWGVKNGEYSMQYMFPCFKIETDKNGDFESITYLYSEDKDTIEYIVKKTVEKYFEEEYDIEISKLNKKYIKDDTKTDLEFLEYEDYVSEYIIPVMTESDNDKDPKMHTRTISINVEK